MPTNKTRFPLQSLPNIGPDTASQLHVAGIDTEDQLREAGTEEVFIRLKTIFPDSCIHRLMAIDGAIKGISSQNLTAERKAELKAFFKQFGK